MRTLRPLISHHDLHLIYNSLITSIVEYAAPLVCIPDQHIVHFLERFFNPCIFITNCKQLECIHFASRPTLIERFKSLSLKFLCKIEYPSNRIHFVLPQKHTYSRHYKIPFHCTTR